LVIIPFLLELNGLDFGWSEWAAFAYSSDKLDGLSERVGKASQQKSE